METMRDKIARAIHDALENDDDSGGGGYARAAVAVLEAMREPSRVMRSQGQWAISDNLTVSLCVENNITAAKVWTRMIDAAKNGA